MADALDGGRDVTQLRDDARVGDQCSADRLGHDDHRPAIIEFHC
jgi:hypothetical protein